jgi:hypothetical protein
VTSAAAAVAAVAAVVAAATAAATMLALHRGAPDAHSTQTSTSSFPHFRRLHDRRHHCR